MLPVRRKIVIKGIVQGVGFRPFIYRLAEKYLLRGYIKNTDIGVEIDIEGKEEYVNSFLQDIRTNSPSLAVIDEIISEKVDPVYYTDFQILMSSQNNNSDKCIAFISPDIAVCSKCLEEMESADNRRFNYSFINCTNCGPRYSIIEKLPYDRPYTTMSEFQLCPTCEKEYQDPLDRRFHAQPVACPECGPSLTIYNKEGKPFSIENDTPFKATDKFILAFIRKMLKEGSIVAVKGLGGYHLVCNALKTDTVQELRRKKMRPDKPFALMMKDLNTARQYCYIPEKDAKILSGSRKPILLVKAKHRDKTGKYLGVMLPYTPLHYQLFDNELSVLVMTSANRSGLPVEYTDQEAVNNLGDVVDFYLMHNRRITTPVEDSVLKIMNKQEKLIRIGRGYSPLILKIPIEIVMHKGTIHKRVMLKRTIHKRGMLKRTIHKRTMHKKNVRSENSLNKIILACGGEKNNTVAFTLCENKFSLYILISQYNGTLGSVESLERYSKVIEHIKSIYNLKINLVVHDHHPQYLTSAYAREMEIREEIGRIEVQHHHAHLVSCMAENHLAGEVIGVIYDGSGFGTDGDIWGGEVLIGSYHNFNRAAHLEEVYMPGGEMAVKEPWRMAVSYLYFLNGKSNPEKINIFENLPIPGHIRTEDYQMILKMIEKGISCPRTSSMGRFFDAAAALIGIRKRITYQGQAAIELEAVAEFPDSHGYRYEYNIRKENNTYIIDTSSIIKGILEDIAEDIPVGIISEQFHNTIISFTVDTCCFIRNDSNINQVVLSGGVFQNEILFKGISYGLESSGFKVYTHNKVPSNDGGLSLGQLVIALTGGGVKDVSCGTSGGD